MRLTRQQVRDIDRQCIETFHIPGVVLMENAAAGATCATLKELADLGAGAAADVLILAGGGNNGGDGLAIARRLHNLGHRVRIGLTIDPASYKGDAMVQWQIVRAMKLEVFIAAPLSVRSSRANLFIDAIFGTGLSQPPRDPFAQLVEAVEATGVPVLAIDVPSGLDCDTGQPLGRAIRARRTITFVAEKAGFANPASHPFTGSVTIADIGAPRELLQALAQAN